MWRSGVMRRRAHAVLLDMIEEAAREGSFEAPWRFTPEVWRHFSSEADILCHLQRHWRTALAGAIYVAIEQGDGNLQGDVRTAYEKIERKHHGVRQVLEAHTDHPAITAAMRKERLLLSGLGLSVDGAPQAA